MANNHHSLDHVRIGLQMKFTACLPEINPPKEMSKKIWLKLRKTSNIRQLGTTYFRGKTALRAFIDVEEEE